MFPNDFLWGASSSSAQIEGGYDRDGRGLSIWDVKKLNPGTCSFHYASDFYHHFKDKYDLINWYFDKILLESFEHMGEGKTIYEALVNKFYYIQKEKLFFKAAFRTDEQNCLKQHDFELIFDFYSRRIESNTGQPVSEHLGFLLEMYCYGSIYMMVQWVLGKQNSTPEDMAKLLVDAMPYDICETFKKLNLL